ncbi:alkane 1-monooxygenase [Aridibaculum aurantiacum]|uniref:alkane 1-monooxygenase n=1 Tax=Aridibaculum aurantiacum TaxID=2810307 RepID=UPI001A95F8C9|nr:alkane 1-monooxygenase [Aridibaculum aurantiacum]
MKLRAYKYASPFIVGVLAWLAFTRTGTYCYLPVLWAYVLIPLAELLLPPSAKNLEQAEEEVANADKTYDYILYAVPVVLYLLLFTFLDSLKENDLTILDVTGRILSMGLLLGAFGINVGHELGHRANKQEQALAKILLLPALYMHFFIEHNRGHHKHVATHNDPNTARENEWLYSFFFRSVFNGYVHAWQIANTDMKKKRRPKFHWQNEMLRFTIYQFLFISLVLITYGIFIFACYLAAAVVGIILLETVNYIEHYGLVRKEIVPGKYERALPHHSWNSNHVLGRLMLFELSRHSDHHFMASRKYQVLRHHDQSPQLPTGYPGMMILAHIPPLFFWVMKRHMEKQAV